MNFPFELSPILMALAATVFTYLITAAGAGTVFFFKNINQKVLDLMMGFAAGVMIAASFWSLLLPAIELLNELGRIAWLETSLGFFTGGILIIVCDIVLERISSYRLAEKRRSLLLVSAVTLHNIPEGLAVGVAFGCAALGTPGATIMGAVTLAIGIGLQNFPEGVCVSLPLRRDGMSRKKSFFIGQLSGMVEPFAGVLGAVAAISARNCLPIALSFSAGAMISVVCSELIPESFRDSKLTASVGVRLGFLTMMILDVAL